MNHVSPLKYPRAWKKISLVIRRLAGGACEWCHHPCENLSVHHIGAPLADGKGGWKKGNTCDKHDIRRENLAALCWRCHSEADRPLREKCEAVKAKRAAKRERHEALGVGTGLILFNEKTVIRIRYQEVQL